MVKYVSNFRERRFSLMKSKKFAAIVMSALMAISTSAVAAPAAFAAETSQTQSTVLSAEPNESVTVEWANGKYPVVKNDKGEYVAINASGKPVKYNGYQIQTTTTQNGDGTQTVETVRYTFKDGKCTDVKTSSKSGKAASSTSAKTSTASQNKTAASTKVTYSNEKYKLNDDGTKVVTAKTGRPVKYNGLLIRTTTTTYTDGSSSTQHDRFNFKDGVLQQEAK